MVLENQQQRDRASRIPLRAISIGSLAALFLLMATVSVTIHANVLANQDESSRRFVIRHARIFDGERVIPGDAVFVQDGKIQAVGTNLKVPPNTAEIDATGDTLLPGLIDSHTHDWGESPKQALLFGVTTELNMSGFPRFVAELKQAEGEGKRLDWADMLSAGYPATPPKGHGTEYGVPVPTLASGAEAQAFVDERIIEGSDYIKIIYEDGHLCHLSFAKFSTNDLHDLISAAHKRRKMAVAHISSQADAREVIEQGADGLAHLFADSMPERGFVKLVRHHNAFVIPTLSMIETSLGSPSGASLLTDTRLSEFLSTDARSRMKTLLPAVCLGKLDYAFAAVKQLNKVGVPILAGTDAPNPGSWNGVSMHGELELLVRAGLSPSEALAAATSVPARTFHLSDRGRIAPTLRADLLLVQGNPTHDITVTRNIVSVWKVGVEQVRKRPGE